MTQSDPPLQYFVIGDDKPLEAVLSDARWHPSSSRYAQYFVGFSDYDDEE